MSWSWRVLTLLTTVLVVWSPAHFVAQSVYEFNSWKFWGFAMYSEPYPLERLYVQAYQNHVPADVTAELVNYPCYSQHRLGELAAYGMLSEPASLLRCVLEMNPDSEHASVVVELQQYRVSTKRFREMRLSWSMRREEQELPTAFRHVTWQQWVAESPRR